MVDWRCRKMNSKDLIRCTFDLSKTELKIFLYLLKINKSIPSVDIANQIELDRTTIQKSLKKLLEKGIVDRRQNNLDNGGYVFLYSVKKKEELKTQMKEIIEDWKSSAEVQLETLFESDDL
jgi:predicted transcriptional regulator